MSVVALVLAVRVLAARCIPWRRVAAIGAALAAGCAAHAHDPGISTAQGDVTADRLVLTTGFAPADVQTLLPPEARTEERWTATEFDAAKARLLQLAPELWDARVGGTRLRPQDPNVELLAGDNVSFRVTFVPPPGAERLVLTDTKLSELPSGHRQFVIISDANGSTVTKKLLSARDGTIEVPLPGTATVAHEGEAPTFWGFVRLGVEHIWTGYDHLLFLFALLVVCRSFRSIVTIVSCFTIAHSLTLAVATLNLVNLPARVVEPAIAASIVFVGAENLWRRGDEPRGRALLTFAFGLIHGFGFASVLRDLGVGAGKSGIAMPLFTFNLGVELGQVAIAALVLPIVWQLRKRPAFVRVGVPVLSLLVVGAGTYWLLERTVFS